MRIPARMKLIMEVIAALPDNCPEPEIDVGPPETSEAEDIFFTWLTERGRTIDIAVDPEGSLACGALLDGHSWTFTAHDSEAAKIIVSKIREVVRI